MMMLVSFMRPLAAFNHLVSRPPYTSSCLLRLSRRQSVASFTLIGFVSAASAAPTTASCHGAQPQQQQQQHQTCAATTRHFQSSSSSSSINMSEENNVIDTGYLDAKSAAALDEELMATPGFTLEQLMELAGLSVAEAVYSVVQDQQQRATSAASAVSRKQQPKNKILVVCGPGNNGGDGLVAARHLTMFGYDCTVVYPKRSSREPHYTNLVQQCHDLSIPVLDEMPAAADLSSFDCIVDAIFGFSFVGTPREPFATILHDIRQAQKRHGVLVVAVDIPSGWNVDDDDEEEGKDESTTTDDDFFLPDVLVSLTAPKLCAKRFVARGGRYHFVGGRFLPPGLAKKYQIRMPDYPGVAQVVLVHRRADTGVVVAADAAADTADTATWQEEYAAHLAKKEATEFATYAKEKPSDDSWEAQYAAYLAQKEKE